MNVQKNSIIKFYTVVGIKSGGKRMTDNSLIDDMLICKGWYNKDKHNTILEALNAYYHKYYRCYDIEMDEAFAISLFLQPLVTEIIKRKPELIIYLFNPVYGRYKNEGNFSELLFTRLLHIITMSTSNIFDLSAYDKMFRESGYII